MRFEDVIKLFDNMQAKLLNGAGNAFMFFLITFITQAILQFQLTDLGGMSVGALLMMGWKYVEKTYLDPNWR
jgi:hypothetical protein